MATNIMSLVEFDKDFMFGLNILYMSLSKVFNQKIAAKFFFFLESLPCGKNTSK